MGKKFEVGKGELVVHFDCDDPFINGLVDGLITACLNRRCSMSHEWYGTHTERLRLKLPAIGD